MNKPRRVIALVLFVILHQGCGASGVPRWLMHVEPPEVQLNISGETYRRRLINELKTPKLEAGYLPAEQIAVMAIESVKANQGFDAAVLLGIASFRYVQQAHFALDQAKQGRVLDTPKDVYLKFVQAEFSLYSNLDFDNENEYLFDELNHRRAKSDTKMQSKYHALFEAKRSKQERQYAKILRSIQSEYRSPKERLAYPYIAKAFLHRLISDAKSDGPLADAASYYLAKTPLNSFRKAALLHPNRYFWPPLCSTMPQHLTVYGRQVVSLLKHADPKVRSNAAIILGLSEDRRYLDQLDGLQDNESDPRVKISLAFARHMLGEDHLQTLVHAVNACGEDSDCEHAIQLIAWLQSLQRVTLSADLFVNQLSDRTNSVLARTAAAMVLGEIQNLDDGHIAALLVATEDDIPFVANTATSAIQKYAHLDSKSVQRHLWGDYGKEALFARWAVIAAPSDLPAINAYATALANQQEPVQEAVIKTLGAVKGKAATDVLTRLYTKWPEHRFLIAKILAHRSDLTKTELNRLSVLFTGTPSLLLNMAVGATDARVRATTHLKKGTFEEKRQILSLTNHYMQCDWVSDISRFSGFIDDKHYPFDALVRYEALSLMLRCALESFNNSRRAKPPRYQDPAFKNGS